MRVTNWHTLWKRYVLIDGREIPLADYIRQQKMDALSAEAKEVMQWLARRKTNFVPVTLVEMSKCLTPVTLRKAGTIRAVMAELMAAGFAEATLQPVKYSGLLRNEAWLILKVKGSWRSA